MVVQFEENGQNWELDQNHQVLPVFILIQLSIRSILLKLHAILTYFCPFSWLKCRLEEGQDLVKAS